MISGPTQFKLVIFKVNCISFAKKGSISRKILTVINPDEDLFAAITVHPKQILRVLWPRFIHPFLIPTRKEHSDCLSLRGSIRNTSGDKQLVEVMRKAKVSKAQHEKRRECRKNTWRHTENRHLTKISLTAETCQ